MSVFGKEERENLRSLKEDLVGPIRSFAAEVREDTVGDAKKFYAAQAKKAQQSAALARDRTKAQMEAIRREQERMQRQRKTAMKRAAITLALLAFLALLIISAALSAHAEGFDYANQDGAGLPAAPQASDGICWRISTKAPGTTGTRKGG